MTEGSPTDEALFLRYREHGDLEAFGRLYDRCGPAIFRFLQRLLRDQAAAEDLTQLAFLRIHEARASFDAGRTFRTWAFTIARRLALNWLEREGHGRRTIRGLDSAESGLEVEDPAPTAERRVIARQELRRVEQALSELAPDDAMVVLLCKYEGLSYAEIGSVVGCSTDAAKMRVHRALKRLAERLG